MTAWQTVPTEPNAAMIRAAPTAPPQYLPRTAAEGWNAALGQIVSLTEASAAALRLRLTERPTRYSYAIAALDALAEASAELVIPVPRDGPEAVGATLPKPNAPLSGSSAQVVVA